MYKIGEFSKITNLSVRTLRYYDEVDVLKPGFVDKFSGYRYYTDENLNDVEIINFMKYVGFSLEEIVMYKDSLTNEVLENKKNELFGIQEELVDKINKINELQKAIKSEEFVKVLKNDAA